MLLPGWIRSHTSDEKITEANRAKSELHITKQRNRTNRVVYRNLISKFNCFENPETIHEV